MMKIVVATRNQGKLSEFRRLLADVPSIELLSLDDVSCALEVVEDGDTFEHNAAKKARETAVAVGLPALADDSGLEVDALGGEPGVLSARYAGEGATDRANNEKLLWELDGVTDRAARFRCVLILVDAEGTELAMTEGVCEGHVARATAGAGGFGYDPLFVPSGETRHMAELAPDEKAAISHRGKATRKMAAYLRQHLR